MGEGAQIQYAFGASGDYSVVVKITNAGSTHGSATATQVVRVDGQASSLSPSPTPSPTPRPFPTRPSSDLALPTASFVFAPTAPAAGEPVTFTFTGACD